MKGGAAQHLDLLLFSVEGVYFGIDAEQVLQTAACNGEDDDLLWIHEVLDFRTTSVVYLTPTIITAGTRGGRRYRVVIDAMEDITQCSLNDLRPLPPVLEPFAMRKGIWGILPRNGRMTLLLDLMSLLSTRVPQPPERRTEPCPEAG